MVGMRDMIHAVDFKDVNQAAELRDLIQVVDALSCSAKHLWLEPNPRIIVEVLAHCSPSSKVVARNGTGHPTSLCRRPLISVLSNNALPNVRNRIWD